ncbi:MAG: tetratricopeptide repeat protein [Gemmatimonadales bacterium]
MNKAAFGIAALVVVTVALGVLQLNRPRVSVDLMPRPDLSVMEPQVTAKLSVLQQLVAADPQSPGAWGRLGMNYDVHGLKQEAVVCYRQAAILDPGDFKWPYYLALALRELQDVEALDWFDTARRIRPDYLPMLVYMGQLQLEQGEIDDARRNFEAALAVDGTASQAASGLVQAALAEDDIETATQRVSSGLAVNPNDRALYTALAEVYRRRGEADLADQTQQTATTLPPSAAVRDDMYAMLLAEGVSSRWYQVRGQQYLNRGVPDSAAALLSLALSVNPEANAYNDLGIALQNLGRYEEAVEQHLAALELRPDFAEAMVSVSPALRRLGRLDEAIEYLLQAQEVNPTMAQIYVNLATYYAGAGRDHEAVAALRTGIANGANDVRIVLRLAWILATSNTAAVRDGAESLRLATQLNEINPNNPFVLDAMAAAHAESGNFDLAVETANRAVELARAARVSGSLLEQLESRLAMYREGRAYREGN